MNPYPFFQPEPPAPRSNRIIWLVMGGLLVFGVCFLIIMSFLFRQVVGSGDVLPNQAGGQFTSTPLSGGDHRVTFKNLHVSLDLPSQPRIDKWDPKYSTKELGRWGNSLVVVCSWNEDVTVWITALWLNKPGELALRDPYQFKELAKGYRGEAYPGTSVKVPSKPPRSEAISFLNSLADPPVKTYCLYIHHKGIWIEIAVSATDQATTATEFYRIVRSIQLC
ncbi:MAG: hypothetical protein ABL962_08165 [Fimbriimonadaceae bacterium]